MTFPDGTDPRAILPGWERLPWIELPRGGSHYRCALACGHIRVYYGGEPGMGVHLALSGQGCREAEALGLITGPAVRSRQQSFESAAVHWDPSRDTLSNSRQNGRMSPPDWPAFIRRCLGWAGRCSRLDIAMDDRRGLLDLADIKEAIRSGDVTSRWKRQTWKVTESLAEECRGCTVYAGSPQSSARLRIYDKAAEQGLPAEEHWVRVELQLRGDRARVMAERLAGGSEQEAGRTFASVLKGYVRFLEGQATRAERRPTAAMWLAFLGDVRASSLGSAPKLPTIEDREAWLRRQVAPTFALLDRYYGGDHNWWHGLLEEGYDRQRAVHEAILARVA